MGALRAAELSQYGMTGVGQIYHWFERGDITRDDDVAISYAHDEGRYWLLTVPMVNVKWLVQDARTNHWLTSGECRRVSLAARRIYWEDRTWQRVCAEAKLGERETASVLEYAKDVDHDLKRLDAVATICRVQEMIVDEPLLPHIIARPA